MCIPKVISTIHLRHNQLFSKHGKNKLFLDIKGIKEKKSIQSSLMPRIGYLHDQHTEIKTSTS